jgi:hypothetical protein
MQRLNLTSLCKRRYCLCGSSSSSQSLWRVHGASVKDPSMAEKRSATAEALSSPLLNKGRPGPTCKQQQQQQLRFSCLPHLPGQTTEV